MQNPWVQERARLPPEPSRVRPCQGFVTLEAKSDDPPTQNPRVQKRARLPPEPSRVRPSQGFATLEAKSDDPSPQNPRVQQRAPLPPEVSRVRPGQAFAALEAKSDDASTQNGSKSARGYRKSPLEYAPAKVSRASKPKVTAPHAKPTDPKRARLPPEPSRVRPGQVSRPWRSKVTTHPKARAATARAL